jgi:hypothetical protein
MDTILKNDEDLSESGPYHNLINPASLTYTPPASSPAEMEMPSHSMHHHHHHHHNSSSSFHHTQPIDSPIRPRTPSLEPSSSSRNRGSLIVTEGGSIPAGLALNNTPPTSPLLCASSTTTSSNSIVSTAGPSDPLLGSFDALGEDSSILIHGEDHSGMDVDAMGISFSGTGCGGNVDPGLGDPFDSLEFLKGDAVGSHSEFGMWLGDI